MGYLYYGFFYLRVILIIKQSYHLHFIVRYLNGLVLLIYRLFLAHGLLPIG
jgi:hypothetical protein